MAVTLLAPCAIMQASCPPLPPGPLTIVLGRSRSRPLKKVRVVTDLAQDVDAGECIAAASQDAAHLMLGEGSWV